LTNSSAGTDKGEAKKELPISWKSIVGNDALSSSTCNQSRNQQILTDEVDYVKHNELVTRINSFIPTPTGPNHNANNSCITPKHNLNTNSFHYGNKNSIDWLYIRHQFLQVHTTKYPTPTNLICTTLYDTENNIYMTLSCLFLNAEQTLDNAIKALEWTGLPLPLTPHTP
jgi:hypothetical protein